MRLLVQYGANVNSQNRYHTTALSEVVMKGDVKMLQTMLEIGADPHVGPDADVSPLALSKSATIPIFKMLKSWGYDPGPHQSGFDCAAAVAHTCDNCGKFGAKKNCSQCKSAWYCTKACQKSAWKTHKAVCKVP